MSIPKTSADSYDPIEGGDSHGSLRATRARESKKWVVDDPLMLLEQVLGWSLVDERRRRGWTQTQLADALGASRESVSRWENSQTLPQARYVVALTRWHAGREAA
jgi:ribosome-binding protein aMBF1 (putative translation factor)